MFDIVGIESPCVDLLLNTEGFPQRGASIPLDSYGCQGGGKVSTGLVAAARLGVNAAVMGRVGSDSMGIFCVDDFIRHRINCDHLLIKQHEMTTLSVVLSDKESRSFLVKHGTCGYLSTDELDHSLLCSTKYLYISKLTDTTLSACSIARNGGVKVFIDADRPSPELIPSLPLFDYFIASEIVYNSLFADLNYEENCKTIRSQGPDVVVFTLGEKGVVGLCNDGFFSLPAFEVEVVDTTGAGDVFHGAFLAGLVNHWSIKDTARFASAVAAIKCTRYGGRAGIPNFQTTLDFIEHGTIDYTEIDQRVAFYNTIELRRSDP